MFRSNHLTVLAAFFAATGLYCIVTYSLGVTAPLPVSAAIVLLSAIVVVTLTARGEIGAISFLLYAFVALSFVHLVPYLFYDWTFPAPPPTSWKPGDLVIWGLAPNPYFFDKQTIELTAELGAAGVSGLLAGTLSYYSSVHKLRIDPPKPVPGWNIILFFLFLAISIVASKFAAPPETIFSANYKGKGAASEAANFASSWLISYAILIFCFADALLEKRGTIKNLKLGAAIASLLYIVIWLQFARGDRESVPMVLATGVMFWHWGVPRLADRYSTKVLLRCATVIGVVFLLLSGQALQGLRHNMAGKSLSETASVLKSIGEAEEPIGGSLKSKAEPPKPASSKNQEPIRTPGDWFMKINRRIPSGTWSAVLLTPLSVAGDSLRGLLPLKWGRTYIDFLLSIPPGFVADHLGYVRPISAGKGPAVDMRYGQGGTHAIVVPFMNFRMVGVVVILAIWGLLFSWIERSTAKSGRDTFAVPKIAVFGLAITVIPHWIWYGEKILINGILIGGGLALLYYMTSPRPSPCSEPKRQA